MTAITNINQNYDKPQSSKKGGFKKTLKALTIGSLALNGLNIAAMLPMEGICKIGKNLTKDEVDFVNKAADTIINSKTNLAKKGVTIENFDSMVNITNTPTKRLEMTNQFFQTAAGKNALFCNKQVGLIDKNTILVNRQKAPILSFHEIGHAFNFNNSAFWKNMQKLRLPSMFLASAFALLPALTKEEKPQNGEELTKAQKVKNEVRKKSPLLAFATMIPVLLEEGKASLRGCSWAKELLDKNMFKKVAKTNAIAYSSYVLGALGFSTMGLVGRKIKDSEDIQAHHAGTKLNTYQG